ncbi:MAG: transcriptional regulator [Candidatus Thermoplasmatota archaeon]|nr:transcriptional regulator [Candidatus Thermoplasmatota archaeon]
MSSSLKQRIAGELVMSRKPNETLKKWREIFHITPSELSKFTDRTPSYISDYESGRRPSPGINTIKMFVEAFVSIDKERGSPVAKNFIFEKRHDAILAIKEFSGPMKMEKFTKMIDGKILVHPRMNRDIMGYTVIDSLKAILNFSSADYHQIYGWSSERCLIFSDVVMGRSPMVAIRAHPMTPAAVIYQRPESIDKLAKKIASIENVYLGQTPLELVELLARLKKI